jgi:hypothetical protein
MLEATERIAPNGPAVKIIREAIERAERAIGVDALLSIAGLAKRWGCRRQQVARLLDRGDVEFTLIAGRRLIPTTTISLKMPRRQPGRRKI